MVTINCWLLGLSAGMLGYIVTQAMAAESFELIEANRAFALAALGFCVSVVAGYVSLLYGGYSNQNWEMADDIADRRGWQDLLPPDEFSPASGLNGIARRLARPCKPKENLPFLFITFIVLSGVSFLAHSALLVWSLTHIW